MRKREIYISVNYASTLNQSSTTYRAHYKNNQCYPTENAPEVEDDNEEQEQQQQVQKQVLVVGKVNLLKVHKLFPWRIRKMKIGCKLGKIVVWLLQIDCKMAKIVYLVCFLIVNDYTLYLEDWLQIGQDCTSYLDLHVKDCNMIVNNCASVIQDWP